MKSILLTIIAALLLMPGTAVAGHCYSAYRQPSYYKRAPHYCPPKQPVAKLQIHVPDGAVVFVNGKLMDSKGNVRKFTVQAVETPGPADVGTSLVGTFNVKVVLAHPDQAAQEQDKTLTVLAGHTGKMFFDFTSATISLASK